MTLINVDRDIKEEVSFTPDLEGLTSVIEALVAVCLTMPSEQQADPALRGRLTWAADQLVKALRFLCPPDNGDPFSARLMRELNQWQEQMQQACRRRNQLCHELELLQQDANQAAKECEQLTQLYAYREIRKKIMDALHDRDAYAAALRETALRMDEKGTHINALNDALEQALGKLKQVLKQKQEQAQSDWERVAYIIEKG